jgi:hypothetical protein
VRSGERDSISTVPEGMKGVGARKRKERKKVKKRKIEKERFG